MPTFGLIIFFRFIQGFALAGVAGAALAYMSEEIHPTHFGFAATLYISCNSLGGMIGRFLMGFLAETYSWEIALFLLGAFGIITFLLVFFMLPQSRHFTGSTKPFIEDMKGFLVHFKNPLLLLMFGLGTILQDRKSTRLNSSHVAISYAVFCLKKNKQDPAYSRSECRHHRSSSALDSSRGCRLEASQAICRMA